MMQLEFQVAPLYSLAFQVEQVLQFCNQAYILHQDMTLDEVYVK
jgi:hypothetical protein